MKMKFTLTLIFTRHGVRDMAESDVDNI